MPDETENQNPGGETELQRAIRENEEAKKTLLREKQELQDTTEETSLSRTELEKVNEKFQQKKLVEHEAEMRAYLLQSQIDKKFGAGVEAVFKNQSAALDRLKQRIAAGENANLQRFYDVCKTASKAYSANLENGKFPASEQKTQKVIDAILAMEMALLQSEQSLPSAPLLANKEPAKPEAPIAAPAVKPKSAAPKASPKKSSPEAAPSKPSVARTEKKPAIEIEKPTLAAERRELPAFATEEIIVVKQLRERFAAIDGAYRETWTTLTDPSFLFPQEQYLLTNAKSKVTDEAKRKEMLGQVATVKAQMIRTLEDDWRQSREAFKNAKASVDLVAAVTTPLENVYLGIRTNVYKNAKSDAEREKLFREDAKQSAFPILTPNQLRAAIALKVLMPDVIKTDGKVSFEDKDMRWTKAQRKVDFPGSHSLPQVDPLGNLFIDSVSELGSVGYKERIDPAGRQRKLEKEIGKNILVIPTGSVNAEAIDWMLDAQRSAKPKTGLPDNVEITFSDPKPGEDERNLAKLKEIEGMEVARKNKTQSGVETKIAETKPAPKARPERNTPDVADNASPQPETNPVRRQDPDVPPPGETEKPAPRLTKKSPKVQRAESPVSAPQVKPSREVARQMPEGPKSVSPERLADGVRRKKINTVEVNGAVFRKVLARNDHGEALTEVTDLDSELSGLDADNVYTADRTGNTWTIKTNFNGALTFMRENGTRTNVRVAVNETVSSKKQEWWPSAEKTMASLSRVYNSPRYQQEKEKNSDLYRKFADKMNEFNSLYTDRYQSPAANPEYMEKLLTVWQEWITEYAPQFAADTFASNSPEKNNATMPAAPIPTKGIQKPSTQPEARTKGIEKPVAQPEVRTKSFDPAVLSVEPAAQVPPPENSTDPFEEPATPAPTKSVEVARPAAPEKAKEPEWYQTARDVFERLDTLRSSQQFQYLRKQNTASFQEFNQHDQQLRIDYQQLVQRNASSASIRNVLAYWTTLIARQERVCALADVKELTEAESQPKKMIEIKDEDTFFRYLKSGRPVIVKFGAKWCEACEKMNKDLETVAKNDLVLSVNVDNMPGLSTDYATPALPVTILMVNGLEVDRRVGKQELATLQQMLQAGKNMLGNQTAGQ